MAVVRGTVCVEETGREIPGVVVNVVDVPTPPLGRPSRRALLSAPRIGALVTDVAGRFELEYDVTAAKDGAAPARPLRNVALVVTAPESTRVIPPLYTSTTVRVGAGGIEEFGVRIPVAALVAAGVPVPAELPEPNGPLDNLGRDERRLRRLVRGERTVARERVAIERTEAALFSTFRRRLVRRLSSAPENVVDPSLRIDDPQQTIAQNRNAIRAGMARRFAAGAPSPLRIRTRFHLDDTQQQALNAIIASGQASLTTAELRTVLTAGSSVEGRDPPASLIESTPVLRRAFPRTAAEQAGLELLDMSGRSAPVTPVPRTLDATVAGRLAALLEPVTAPEDGVSAPGRGDQADVQSALDGFSLRPGPADVPALFDFHRLEIAFDNVWQDVIDEDVLLAAHDLFRSLRRRGGRPVLREGQDPLDLLAHEARVVAAAEPVELTAALRRRPSDFGVGVAADPDATVGIVPDHAFPITAARPERPWDMGTDAVADPDATVGLAPDRPSDLLTRLEALIGQSYPFTIYGASAGSRSVNFGIVATYRQRWTPVTYQVGRLVGTLPLTPGESRKVSYRTVVRHKRLDRSLDRWDEMHRDETNTTTRAESEIVAKAMAKTSFELMTKGTYNLWLAKGDSRGTLGTESATDSSDTKRNFHEAVVRAANEYKHERTTEFSTEEAGEDESSTAQEIKNDNNELHVTYLFYELQRRFRVTERIHRVTPVVLVAQEVPNPSAITDAWVLAHDWIIRRTLLDEKLLPALDYVASRAAGDRLALSDLGQNVAEQRALVTALRQNLLALETQATRRYEALQAAIEDRASQIGAEDTDGFLSDTVEFFTGGGESPDAARIREEAARDAQERAVEEVKALQLRLQREVTALNEITERYAKLRSEHRNREIQIARLRLHVKQNILHYMHAIWTFEVPHQRFLRLHQVQVPRFIDAGTSFTPTGESFPGQVTGVDVGGGAVEEAPGIGFDANPNLVLDQTEDPLVEIADLDQLMGFHGNYMIFPLKRPNPLTEYMTMPYVDAGWRLMDPDEPQSMTLDEFAEYVVALREQLSDDEFTALKPALKERYKQLLTDPLRQNEEIVVPSDSLYVDALPGTRPTLEDFKLLHRGLDVRIAQARVRQSEMENLRYASRLLTDEFDDPEIDKQIVVEGGQFLITD